MTEPKDAASPEKKKTLTLSEDDIRTDRRGPGGSVGRVGTGPNGASKVIDPTGRGPGAPNDPDS
jgi:hypothetical protein